jgi:hypothetical protein
MALKPWPAFHPDVLMHVPGCPIPVVDHHLRKAAIELCGKSKRLKIDMPAFDTVAGEATYPLDAGTDLDPVIIVAAEVDGVPIDPVRIHAVSSQKDWRIESGKPTDFYLHPDDKTVRLWKTPDAAYSIAITLAAKPTQAASGIEAWFGDRYGDGIVAGALAQLFALPKKPWTDLGMAGFHAGRFETSARSATAEADKDGTSAPIRTLRVGRF